MPQPFGLGTWTKHKILKIVSGSQHSLALTTDKKVFGWGDAESGKIGRSSNTRQRFVQAMHIEAVGVKNAIDIFCGKECSFAINSNGKVFAWGLNNWGQLGIGDRFSTPNPTEIKELTGKNISMLAGGEHHSIACDA